MNGIDKKTIELALKYAAEVLGGDSGGHDLSHIRRVMKNAELIMDGEDSGPDRDLVLLCCALHDVDDRKLKSAGEPRFARLDAFCALYGLDNVRDRIAAVIERVSFTDNPTRDPSMPGDAAIVQDADRLDALGAVGIARAFAYGGKTGRAMYGDAGSTAEHFYSKLLRLPELMNTRTARIMADSRVSFMKEFLARLSIEAGEEIGHG